MPYKDKEKQKQAQREHYIKNKTIYKDRTRKTIDRKRIQLQEFINEIKSSNPCSDCKQYFHPHVMDFDHVWGEKKAKISKLVNHGHSLQTVIKEIEKCELVCANCHRLRTWKRLNGLLA